jgi:hypothetical protein
MLVFAIRAWSLEIQSILLKVIPEKSPPGE